MVKPDGVAAGLIDEISRRITQAGLQIVSGKLANMTLDDATKLYKVHEGKSFYNGLVKFITSGPVFLMKVQGENAVLKVRSLMGATDPRKAEIGTIRGDYKAENIFTEDGTMKNIIHGSDSKENAEYELSIFF